MPLPSYLIGRFNLIFSEIPDYYLELDQSLFQEIFGFRLDNEFSEEVFINSIIHMPEWSNILHRALTNNQQILFHDLLESFQDELLGKDLEIHFLEEKIIRVSSKLFRLFFSHFLTHTPESSIYLGIDADLFMLIMQNLLHRSNKTQLRKYLVQLWGNYGLRYILCQNDAYIKQLFPEIYDLAHIETIIQQLSFKPELSLSDLFDQVSQDLTRLGQEIQEYPSSINEMTQSVIFQMCQKGYLKIQPAWFLVPKRGIPNDSPSQNLWKHARN